MTFIRRFSINSLSINSQFVFMFLHCAAFFFKLDKILQLLLNITLNYYCSNVLVFTVHPWIHIHRCFIVLLLSSPLRISYHATVPPLPSFWWLSFDSSLPLFRQTCKVTGFRWRSRLNFENVLSWARRFLSIWITNVAVPIVSGARGIVPLVCSIVLSESSGPFPRDLARAATPSHAAVIS